MKQGRRGYAGNSGSPFTIEGVQHQPHELRPYLRLWAAVFHRGIVDFCTCRALGRRDERFRWFHSDEVHAGSFVWLCQLFGFDQEKARSAVLAKWRAQVDKAMLKEERQNGGRRGSRNRVAESDGSHRQEVPAID